MRFFNFDIGIRIRTSREIELEKQLEQRNAQTGPSGWGPAWDALMSDGGYITRKQALSVPAVYAAVDVVSKTLASIPFSIFTRTADGSEEAFSHPLYPLINLEPYPYYTAFNWRRDMAVDACFGNTYAKIHFKGNGRAGKLEYIPSENWQTYWGDDGELYYLVTYGHGSKTKTEVLFQYEVLHVRGMSIEQWQGIDVASTFSSSLKMSIGATNYGYNFFNNNAAVDGVIEYPGGLDPKQREIYENKIREKKAGIKNVGGVMVLDAGAKYNKIGTDPQGAMLNETRNFQAYESCRIFGVPAHMINVLDRSTFNNIEMMDNGFVKYCLVPWAEQFEQELAVKLLTASEKTGPYGQSVFFRHDVSGLMRGDMKSQGEFYERMLKSKVFVPNDVLKQMNMNTVEWGDRPFIMAGETQMTEDFEIPVAQQPAAATGSGNQDNNQDTKPAGNGN